MCIYILKKHFFLKKNSSRGVSDFTERPKIRRLSVKDFFLKILENNSPMLKRELPAEKTLYSTCM